VRAQQRALPVIGLLSTRSPAVDTPLIALIRQGLGESGFVEGQNIARFVHRLDDNRLPLHVIHVQIQPERESG